MRRLSRYFVLTLLLLNLTGCRREQLAKQAETFVLNDSEYVFHLPAAWEKEGDYQTKLNEAAVFGAEDTNSRSVMFVRGEPSPPLTKVQLQEQTKQLVGAHYLLENAVIDAFEVAGRPAIHYRLPSVYKKKAAWLDMYYVVTETDLINFQFYRPKNHNNADKQAAVIKQAVQSLKQTSQRTTAASETIDQAMSVTLTGYKIEKQRLVIRYVFKNNGEATIIPAVEWSRLVSLHQSGLALVPVTEAVSDDDELAYLQAIGTAELATGKSIESAAVYLLPTSEEVLLEFDADVFNGKQPMYLSINS